MLPRSQVNAVAEFHFPERDMVLQEQFSDLQGYEGRPGVEHFLVMGSTAAAARHNLTGCHNELVEFKGEIHELLDLDTTNTDYPEIHIVLWRVPLEELRKRYRYRSVMEGRSEFELAKEDMERYLEKTKK